MPIVWDTIEQQSKLVESQELKLSKSDKEIFDQYKKNNGNLELNQDPDICKQNIANRIRLIGNYLVFAGNKQLIQQTLNPKMETLLSQKPEYSEILKNYRSFYEGINWAIHDNSINEDNIRLFNVLSSFTKYDTLINLYNRFYDILAENEVTAKDFKHIRKTLVQYRNTLSLPSSINDINQMKKMVADMEKMKSTLQTNDKKALDKEVKSAKEYNDKLRILIGI
ncbi:MAG: hypothetical protein IJ524_06575 [Bacteroidales bacterium]|nr:hypothetical protein [Bacteroidales bacterium]